MYRDQPFRVLRDDEIETQLKTASDYTGQIERVFLENGDPFALNGDKLLHITNAIRILRTSMRP
jgi:hypothetical protein